MCICKQCIQLGSIVLKSRQTEERVGIRYYCKNSKENKEPVIIPAGIVQQGLRFKECCLMDNI